MESQRERLLRRVAMIGPRGLTFGCAAQTLELINQTVRPYHLQRESSREASGLDAARWRSKSVAPGLSGRSTLEKESDALYVPPRAVQLQATAICKLVKDS